jgi:putative spermidine/putrescine transport system permease protein
MRRVVLFALLFVWAVLPLALLLVVSLGRTWFFPGILPAGWTAESWLALAESGRLHVALAHSIVLAVPTGIVAALIAWPVGRAIASANRTVRHIGAALAFLPVAAPPVALAAGLHWSFLWLGLGGSFAGVLFAHIVPASAYAALYMLGVFTTWDTRAEDAARTLGASPMQVRLLVTLPLLRRPLLEAWLLGFLVSWAQLPLTLVVGGGLISTLPLEVFAYMQAGQDRYAATGALLLLIPPLIALAATRAAAGRTEAVVM